MTTLASPSTASNRIRTGFGNGIACSGMAPLQELAHGHRIVSIWNNPMHISVIQKLVVSGLLMSRFALDRLRPRRWVEMEPSVGNGFILFLVAEPIFGR